MTKIALTRLNSSYSSGKLVYSVCIVLRVFLVKDIRALLLQSFTIYSALMVSLDDRCWSSRQPLRPVGGLSFVILFGDHWAIKGASIN